MVKLSTNLISLSIAVVLIILRVVGLVSGLFFGVMAALFLVLGVVLSVFLVGSGDESTRNGAVLIVMGVIMILILLYVEPLFTF